MGEKSTPVQLGLVLNTGSNWTKNKIEGWGFFLYLKNIPKYETETQTLCLLYVTDIDDLQDNTATKQNTVPFLKNRNSKYPEKLTKILDSEWKL